jgi:hypothetical protein
VRGELTVAQDRAMCRCRCIQRLDLDVVVVLLVVVLLLRKTRVQQVAGCGAARRAGCRGFDLGRGRRTGCSKVKVSHGLGFEATRAEK